MTSPVIHFVVPYYGSSDYLAEAVDSVLAQDDPHWRLTVIEDGHHPDLDEPVWHRRFADDRVSRVTNSVRLGLTANFQRALEHAAADWAVFLGCDDVLTETYVSTVRAALRRHPDADIIQPGVQVIDQAGNVARPLADRVKSLLRRRQRGVLLSGESLAASLMHGNWLYFPSLCWRTGTIKRFRFRQDLPTTLDLALVAEVLLENGRLLVVDDVVFRYRRHAASASSAAASSRARFEEEKRLFGELGLALAGRGWPRAARAARWHLTSRAHHFLTRTRARAIRTGTVT